MHRTPFSAFQGRLLQALGLAALAAPLFNNACGSSVHFDDDENTTGSNGPGATSAQSSASGQQGTAVGGTSSSGSNGNGGAAASGSGQGGSGGGSTTDLACFPHRASGCPPLEDAPAVFGSCTPDAYYIVEWLDGPFIQPNVCCYEVYAPDGCEGRPLVLDGGVRTAVLEEGSRGWAAELEACFAADDDALDGVARAALARAWQANGLFEHASVASFARVALELMAAGAPAELVAASHAAALDEVRHAKLCFALADRFRGQARGPGKLDLGASLPLRSELADLAASATREGCIGETVAALLADEQRRRATDPEVRRVLDIIAADEARHAELAWRTVAWALSAGGDEVRRAVAQVFAEAEAGQNLPRLETCPDAGLEGCGVLADWRARDLVRRAVREVVLPCARALLASGGHSADTLAITGSPSSVELPRV
jgi:hypothetical protein